MSRNSVIETALRKELLEAQFQFINTPSAQHYSKVETLMLEYQAQIFSDWPAESNPVGSKE